jgi:thioredoxin 1
MIFRDGVLLYREPGALPANALADIIEQVKALDMVAIKKEIAEAESEK